MIRQSPFRPGSSGIWRQLGSDEPNRLGPDHRAQFGQDACRDLAQRPTRRHRHRVVSDKQRNQVISRDRG